MTLLPSLTDDGCFEDLEAFEDAAYEHGYGDAVEEIVAFMRLPDLDSVSGHAATAAWANQIEERFGR
jgi:hypothetical protein